MGFLAGSKASRCVFTETSAARGAAACCSSACLAPPKPTTQCFWSGFHIPRWFTESHCFCCRVSGVMQYYFGVVVPCHLLHWECHFRAFSLGWGSHTRIKYLCWIGRIQIYPFLFNWPTNASWVCHSECQQQLCHGVAWVEVLQQWLPGSLGAE